MRRPEMFSTLNDEEYQQFIAIFEPQTFNAGDIILQEFHAGKSAYLLLRGEVKILKKTALDEEYTVDSMDEESVTALFGELCLLDGKERSATVIAVNEVETLKIDSETMFAFFEQHMQIGYKVMLYLAKSCAAHLRKADADAIILFNALVDEIKE